MKIRHYVIYILTVSAMIAGMTWFLFFRTTDKETVRIEFIEKDSFILNEEIEPLSLIKSSTTTNIIYPKIDTSAPGEKELLYIAIGEEGTQKEFMKVIKVHSPIPPILQLTKDVVTIQVEGKFDPKKYIQKSYDEFDGNLETKIEGTYDVNQPGTYHLTYLNENSSGMKTKKDLTLIVKEEEKPVQENVPVTGTNEVKTDVPVEENNHQIEISRSKWMFQDGFDFSSGRDACMAEGKSIKAAVFTCDVIYDENDIPIGYQLLY